MRRIQIITDSCADLGGDLLQKYNIDYAKMTTVYNGEEAPALLTWSAEEAHRMYEIMREGNRITTAQVPTEEFIRVFEKYLSDNCDIIYIGCSLKQSGSVNTGHVVAESVKEKYPDARIECIDSLNASLGEGMLAVKAAELADEGKSFDEIVGCIKSMRKNVNEYVTVHSLDALKRAGRVKGSTAFFGNLMGVKPILIADADGEQAAFKKVKGRANSFSEIVSMLKSSITEPETQTVYIAHGDCAGEEIDGLVELVKREIPCKDVYVGIIGPIIGASIGPDAVGIWGFGEQVTFKVGDKK